MPSRPPSLRYPGLTKRQGDFAREFVSNGGRRSDAAVAAGYAVATARIEAYRLLQKPAVVDAIRKESERALQGNVALGQHVLANLAEHAVSETVRLAAAQALLDRGGLQLVRRSEQTINVVDQRTDAELVAHAQRLARELDITIDGTDLVRERLSALSSFDPRPPKPISNAPGLRSQFPAAKILEVSSEHLEIFS